MTRIDFALGCAPQEALVAAVIPWLRAEGGPRSGRSTELARFEIRGGRMTVRVNSQRRAEAVVAEIAARLGDRTRLKGRVVESVGQMMGTMQAGGASSGAAAREREEMLQLPELQALLSRLNDEHWAAWPDVPLPALRGKTPREAARTVAGKERLEALLVELTGD